MLYNSRVNQHTLIPRPDSEALIDLALTCEQDFQQVYDIGCGSGCLGISFLKHKPSFKQRLYMIDNSYKALQILQAKHQEARCLQTSYFH